MWSCASMVKNTENHRVTPEPIDGTNCSDVISPGIRENLFSPTATLNASFGSVSPVSKVNSPGFPSSAGMGVNRGESLDGAFVPATAANAAFTGARARAGVVAASVAGVASVAAAGVVGVAAAASVAAGSAVAVVVAVLAASALAAAGFLSSAFVVSAPFAAPAVNAAVKNRMAAHRRNLIIPPPLLPHSFGYVRRSLACRVFSNNRV